MKYTLTRNDQHDINRFKKSALQVVFNFIKEQKFNVGDILVKKTYNYDESSLEIESTAYDMYSNSNLQRRYLVVEVEESGIFYYSYIGENGKLEGDIECSISLFDDTGWGSYNLFEIDPLFIDAVLLGEQFDIGNILREERERKQLLIDKNKESAVSFKSFKKLNQLIESIPIGETIFFHDNDSNGFNQTYCNELKISRRTRHYASNFMSTKRWARLRNRCTFMNDKELISSIKKAKYVLYLKDNSNQKLITTADLLDKAIYLTKPFSLRDT